MISFYSFFYRSIFAKLICTFTFLLTRIYLPRLLRTLIIPIFCRVLKINRQESEHDTYDYSSLNRLFTRGLRKDCRPIDGLSNSLISPVDGVLLRFGISHRNRMIQAKELDYSLSDLIEPYFLSNFTDCFYFTIYLSPSDCHRVFSPVSGSLLSTYHLSGSQLPVREPFISGYRNLYCINERIVSIISSEFGYIAMVNVGALNVSCLSIQHHPSCFHSTYFMKNNESIHYEEETKLEKGDWYSTFHLGSTVILIVPRSLSLHSQIKSGMQLRYGEILGLFS